MKRFAPLPQFQVARQSQEVLTVVLALIRADCSDLTRLALLRELYGLDAILAIALGAHYGVRPRALRPVVS